MIFLTIYCASNMFSLNFSFLFIFPMLVGTVVWRDKWRSEKYIWFGSICWGLDYRGGCEQVRCVLISLHGLLLPLHYLESVIQLISLGIDYLRSFVMWYVVSFMSLPYKYGILKRYLVDMLYSDDISLEGLQQELEECKNDDVCNFTIIFLDFWWFSLPWIY